MVFINADTIKAELLGALQLIKVAVVEVLPCNLAPRSGKDGMLALGRATLSFAIIV
jgi:hypothetical protein